jgi:N-acetylmuramic acid 6-phosphate etherase
MDQRLTEQRNPRTRDIDDLSALEIVDVINREDRGVAEAVGREREAVARALEMVEEAFRGGGRLIYVGAGTSGRLGVLDAAEMPPTFGTDPEMVQGVIAGGYGALVRAREGAEDREDEGRRAVADLGPDDLVIGLSASSVTPFARGALEEARSLGAGTVLLTCASSEGLEAAAEEVVALDTGPEILTGSTRLKAGSATKAALNAITTAAMVRLGKTYGNLMVDLRPGSAKLVDRSRRIVQAATGASAEEAVTLLEQAGGMVKTAIVMGRAGVDAEAARERLSKAGGRVREAVAETGLSDR